MTQYRNNPRPRQWGRVPSHVVLQVQQGLRDGLTYFEITQATGVSSGSIGRIRRNMNLAIASRRSFQPVPDKIGEAVREGIKMGMSYKDIKSSFGVSAGRIATIKRSMGLLGALSDSEPDESVITAPQDEPQQDVSTYTPQQYFEAISEGIAEYHRDLAVLESRLEDLTSKNKDLYDALIQAKAKATNWSAPPRIPSRNMSNGG